jgi:hypothetical protein
MALADPMKERARATMEAWRMTKVRMFLTRGLLFPQRMS